MNERLTKELDKAVYIYKPTGNFGWGTLNNIADDFYRLALKDVLEAIDELKDSHAMVDAVELKDFINNLTK